MKPLLARRPSPAMAIACTALFAALGGVSYGFATGTIDSREIADDTVRSKDVRNNTILTRDLRNNDVRGIDVRNNTLRGRDLAPNTLTDDQIDESKLTEVPRAADAGLLDGRPSSYYAPAQPEALHVVGAPGEPPFEGGYGATGGGAVDPAFWRDGVGGVRLQGAIDVAGAPAPGDPVLTLPEDYRPPGTVTFAVPGGTILIAADGEVRVGSGDPETLDGIVFRAAG